MEAEGEHSTNTIIVNGNFSELPISHAEAEKDIRLSLRDQRDAIASLPTQEEGIQMDRVRSYSERVGFPKKDVKVLDPVNYKKAIKIAGNENNGTIDEEGIYLGALDIVLVKRDPEMELLNGGPEYTESIVIHELAHSFNPGVISRIDVTAARRYLRRNLSATATDLRSGFLVTNKHGGKEGSFLEEGYAEFERGLYVSEELGKSHGFSGVQLEDKSLERYTYVVKGPGGIVNAHFSQGAFSAATVGLLIAYDQELLDALRESRRSLDGGRQVAQRINAIRPGLYQELRKADIPLDENAANMYIKVRGVIDAKREA